MIAWRLVTARPAGAGHGMQAYVPARRNVSPRQGTSTRYSVLMALLMLGLGLVIPVQAQNTGQMTDLSDISGLTPPERSAAGAIDTLCPQLNPNVTTGGVGDLQIRCTEMTGNANAGNTSAARTPLLPLSPEEIIAQGTNAVKTSNRNIDTRLAALRSVGTNLGFRRFALQPETPAVPYTLVASLDSTAAANNLAVASSPSLFSRLSFFANGTFTGGDKDATSREAGFDFKTFGATVGADYRFTDNVVLGVAFNYLSTDIDFDSTSFVGSPSGGGIDTHSFGFAIYGTYYIANQFYVDGIVNFGCNTRVLPIDKLTEQFNFTACSCSFQQFHIAQH